MKMCLSVFWVVLMGAELLACAEMLLRVEVKFAWCVLKSSDGV